MRADAFRWFVRGAGLALGAAFVYGILSVGLQASQVLILVFLAVLLGSALEPVVGALRDHLPLGRGATILVVYLSFFLLVVGMALVIVPDALAQLNQYSANLPSYLSRIRGWGASLQPHILGTMATSLVDAAQRITVSRDPPNPATVVQAGLTLAEVAVSVVSLLAIVFFWLTEHAWLQRYALSFVAAPHRAGMRDAWNEIETRLGLWVRGQLILMGAVGIATGLAYSILGLPSPLLLGVLAGILEAIPMAGPLLGAIPALLVAATISPQLMLLVGLVYVAIQFAEGNILVPLVMRNTIGLSPFLVIVALLIGGAVGGIPGAFLAVPITAAVEVVLERLQAREAPVAEDPASVQEPAAAKQRRMQTSLPDSPGQAQAEGTDDSAAHQHGKARSTGPVDRTEDAQGRADDGATDADADITSPAPRRRRGRAVDPTAATRP